MKASLIINSLSGGYSRSKVDKICRKLEAIDIEVSVYGLGRRQWIGDIINKLDPEQTPLLLLAFGDGTINSAINVLARRSDLEKFRVAIVPLGTTNVLAAELNTNSPRKLLKALKNNRTQRLHLGKIRGNFLSGKQKNEKNMEERSIFRYANAIERDTYNSVGTGISSADSGDSNENIRYFSLMASAGIDSLTVKNVDDRLKGKIGKLAYIHELLRLLLKRSYRGVRISLKGNSYEGVAVCVSNGKYYGGKIPITAARMEEANFQVIIVRKFKILSIIRYMISRKSNENIIKLETKKARIEADQKNYPLQIDGDYCCNLPVEIETSDKYVNVFCLRKC